MPINTDHVLRCIRTLESALEELQKRGADDDLYDIIRAAAAKEFEIVLEQSGRLLKKRLRPYFASNRQVDRLTFKDAFRHATKHGLISVVACERWLVYRDNGNETDHDHGAGFAEATLPQLPAFAADARALAKIIEEGGDD